MLGEAGSIASVVGLLVSLLGLGFALLQLSRLRGEARAAREAAEETRQLLLRDSAGTDLTRIGERIQGLIEIHRSGDRARALDRYPEIYRLLIEIRRNHPNLDEEYGVDSSKPLPDCKICRVSWKVRRVTYRWSRCSGLTAP